MSQKLSEMTEEKRDAMEDELEAVIDVARSRDAEGSVRQNEKFGLCSTCTRFCHAITEFKTLFAVCNRFSSSGHAVGLNTAHPVTECTEYHRVTNQPSLWDMKQMAYIIEGPKRKVGF